VPPCGEVIEMPLEDVVKLRGRVEMGFGLKGLSEPWSLDSGSTSSLMPPSGDVLGSSKRFLNPPPLLVLENTCPLDFLLAVVELTKEHAVDDDDVDAYEDPPKTLMSFSLYSSFSLKDELHLAMNSLHECSSGENFSSVPCMVVLGVRRVLVVPPFWW